MKTFTLTAYSLASILLACTTTHITLAEDFYMSANSHNIMIADTFETGSTSELVSVSSLVAASPIITAPMVSHPYDGCFDKGDSDLKYLGSISDASLRLSNCNFIQQLKSESSVSAVAGVFNPDDEASADISGNIVPAPSGALLAALGASLIGWLRKRNALK